MQTLLNFAHPLSEKVTKQIEEEIGEFIKEVRVTCQLNLSGKGQSLIKRRNNNENSNK